jgi:hypothetical protein
MVYRTGWCSRYTEKLTLPSQRNTPKDITQLSGFSVRHIIIIAGNVTQEWINCQSVTILGKYTYAVIFTMLMNPATTPAISVPLA